MNKLKKTLALVATLAIASTAFVACDDDKDTSTGNSTTNSTSDSKADSTADSKGEEGNGTKFTDDGEKLSILCWTDNDVKFMNQHFEETNPDYAGKVQYVNVGSEGAEAREKYATYFQGDEDADLFVLEADWILDYINNDDYTAPMSDLGFEASDFDGCYEYTVAVATNDNGVLKGASWQSTPGGYVYRYDLAEKLLGVKTNAEMQAKMKDWDTALATAKELKDASNGKTALYDSLGGIWQVYSYNRSSAWADKDDNLVIDDYCKTYADIAKTMWDEGYVSTVDQWGEGWLNQAADESVLGYTFCTWCLGAGGQLESAAGGVTREEGKDDVINNPDLYNKFDIIAGPSGYAWGGSWLALSPKCDNGTMAKAYVEHFTINEETMESYALFKGEFVNNPTVMEKVGKNEKSNNPMLRTNPWSILFEAAGNIDMTGKITAFDSQIKKAYSDSIANYLKGVEGYTSYDDMINEFKKAAAQIEGLNVQ